MTSSFLPGFEPMRRGWKGRLCPRCIRDRNFTKLNRMTPEERRDFALRMILDNPTVPVPQLAEQEGVHKNLLAQAKTQAYERGLIERDKPKPRPKVRATHKPRSKKEQMAADLAIVKENPDLTRAQFEELAGVERWGARKRLRRLLDVGLIARSGRSREGRVGRPLDLYRVAT